MCIYHAAGVTAATQRPQRVQESRLQNALGFLGESGGEQGLGSKLLCRVYRSKQRAGCVPGIGVDGQRRCLRALRWPPPASGIFSRGGCQGYRGVTVTGATPVPGGLPVMLT